MKPSHIHSPRTMADAVWHSGPVERYDAHGLRALLSRWLQRIFN